MTRAALSRAATSRKHARPARRLQAQAILDMQLQRLTGLERQKILDEFAELLTTIERLRAILAGERC